MLPSCPHLLTSALCPDLSDQMLIFSVFLPYVILLCFLIRGLFLEGATTSLRRMVTTEVRLGTPNLHPPSPSLSFLPLHLLSFCPLHTSCPSCFHPSLPPPPAHWWFWTLNPFPNSSHPPPRSTALCLGLTGPVASSRRPRALFPGPGHGHHHLILLQGWRWQLCPGGLFGDPDQPGDFIADYIHHLYSAGFLDHHQWTCLCQAVSSCSLADSKRGPPSSTSAVPQPHGPSNSNLSNNNNSNKNNITLLSQKNS